MLGSPKDIKALLRRRRMPADVRRYLVACRSSGAVFIHIPKTGGKSMIRALYNLDTHEGPGHATAAFYEAALGPTAWKRCTKIAVVRDPWKRLYSAYAFAKGGGFGLDADEARGRTIAGGSFPAFVNRLAEDETLRRDILLRPQTHFLRRADDSLCNAELLRTDSLAADAQRLARDRGLAIGQVPHANRSASADPERLAADREATIALVRGIYASDYDLLRDRFGPECFGG